MDNNYILANIKDPHKIMCQMIGEDVELNEDVAIAAWETRAILAGHNSLYSCNDIERMELCFKLTELGYDVVDLDTDELAMLDKLHPLLVGNDLLTLLSDVEKFKAILEAGITQDVANLLLEKMV